MYLVFNLSLWRESEVISRELDVWYRFWCLPSAQNDCLYLKGKMSTFVAVSILDDLEQRLLPDRTSSQIAGIHPSVDIFSVVIFFGKACTALHLLIWIPKLTPKAVIPTIPEICSQLRQLLGHLQSFECL